MPASALHPPPPVARNSNNTGPAVTDAGRCVGEPHPHIHTLEQRSAPAAPPSSAGQSTTIPMESLERLSEAPPTEHTSSFARPAPRPPATGVCVRVYLAWRQGCHAKQSVACFFSTARASSYVHPFHHRYARDRPQSVGVVPTGTAAVYDGMPRWHPQSISTTTSNTTDCDYYYY